MKPLNICIHQQGGPIFGNGKIVSESDNFIAFEIDMTSKYCEIVYENHIDDCPGIAIGGSFDHSIHLTKGLEDKLTVISFPDYVGWNFWISEISRYTFRGGLIKEEYHYGRT